MTGSMTDGDLELEAQVRSLARRASSEHAVSLSWDVVEDGKLVLRVAAGQQRWALKGLAAQKKNVLLGMALGIARDASCCPRCFAAFDWAAAELTATRIVRASCDACSNTWFWSPPIPSLAEAPQTLENFRLQAPAGGDVIFKVGAGHHGGNGVAPGEGGSFRFLLANGTEALRLQSDGRVFVCHREVETPPELVAAFAAWVRAATIHFADGVARVAPARL